MELRTLLFYLLICVCVSTVSMTKKLICFFSNPKVINPNLCTHLIYYSAALSKNDTTILSDGIDPEMFKQAIALKSENPNLKIMISLGGLSNRNPPYNPLFNKESTRTEFVKQAVKFLKEINFDGLDIVWISPGRIEQENFAKLLSELREAFNQEDLLLSAAIINMRNLVHIGYDILSMAESLDFVYLLTHYFSYETTFPSSPLYNPNEKFSVSDIIEFLIQLGMPPEKIMLGIPIYGYSYTLASKFDNKIGSPKVGPGKPGKITGRYGTLAYFEICNLTRNENWMIKFDDRYKSSYAYKNDQWIAYEDPKSLKFKLDFLNSENLGGAMIWALREIPSFIKGFISPSFDDAN